VHQEALTSQHLLETEQRYGVNDEYLAGVAADYAHYEQHGTEVVAADDGVTTSARAWDAGPSAGSPPAAKGDGAPYPVLVTAPRNARIAPGFWRRFAALTRPG